MEDEEELELLRYQSPETNEAKRKFRVIFGTLLGILIVVLLLDIVFGIYVLNAKNQKNKLITLEIQPDGVYNTTTYLNEKETKLIYLDVPVEEQEYRYYFTCDFEITESGTFLVKFDIECDGRTYHPLTDFVLESGYYKKQVQGNSKTQLFFGLGSSSKVLDSNIKVYVNVYVEKLS